MEEHLFPPVPEELPSPEELFDANANIKEPVSVSRRKPIPRYRVVKRVSVGFLVFLLVLILAVTGMKLSGCQFYYMKSESMHSMIPEGSFLFEWKIRPEHIEPGDVITYINRDGISVTHEVIRVITDDEGMGAPAFRTKGRDNKYSDREIVTSDMIQGKVVFYIPYLGAALAKLKLA